MRLLDSHLSSNYETIGQILVRENAIVFSMEHVKAIIMADKVASLLSLCTSILQYLAITLL